jgi:D-amino-acid dehydrogenase
VAEHDALAAEAGASHLIRRNGWIKLFRTAKERDERLAEAESWRRDFGLPYAALDQRGLREKEPHLDQGLIGGLHWIDPTSTPDPGGLTRAYGTHFERLGGCFAQGDARTLAREPEGWTLRLADGGRIAGRDVVVCLGPWSDLVTRAFGYRIPFAVKRGYHMHYRLEGNAVLNHPCLDVERGYFLAPMVKGVRLTTGAEFALRDAAPTPVQLARAEPIARSLLALGERLDPEPWMGCRPCTPDMLPVIGMAPRHDGLFLAFGHAHHGLTLGPVTGRLIAEMVTGEQPFIDPAPYAPDRFNP